ncbi:tRNA 5-methylaminomethyl-2-thiouridine biosynthesis bifunctional protein MnmC [Algimonas arctica]|uniref:tRNA 5-methylaminomethyl-2-thiouridine biosynthesis bifunctional protein MnmC n=1 Tax=Algimonas arctica TaxID=1479486 RepID=A0A8J3CR74_9PROT|nr:tRNA (5-methylaminomethyl-2-thiouridine)(34)-methyltransferase MnmD [Algimonas arctica]GHA89004.1 tRNA 5-methylaminomethyl-2-thiouridine biosynthesis bifunctional protein MnmC [Algimonas arctica]
MPGPTPLTRTPAPSLDFSVPGTPAAADFDDIYFSADGGLDEARAVFLTGCGLPERWMDRDVFTIAELGFGSGLNFLATWQAWQTSGAKGRLHYISVEGFPFEQADLHKALSQFPELSALAAPLIDQWPGPVRGLHRRHFGNVTLTLIHDAVSPALRAQTFQADAWFLDGFSPAKNADMWSPAIIAEIARLSEPGARVATFTVAGDVRRSLNEAGFVVSRQPGFGHKRQRLEAIMPGEPIAPTAPLIPTIIGDGIAGASIARAFMRRGLLPRVIADPDHLAASGNGAALIKPRFDLQDNPASRFFLSSFLYARHAYQDAIRHEGILHLNKSAKERDRHQRLVDQDCLGRGHMKISDEGVYLGSSLVIDTETARQSFLKDINVESRHIDTLDALDGPIILASGYGIRTLLPDTTFRYSRGQLSWTNGTLAGPVTYGGYAIPIRDEILLGATHDRIEDHSTAFELSPTADAKNLGQAQAQGLSVGPDLRSFRTSVRVNSPDTLPRLIKMKTQKAEQDLWVLSGLGSRGFTFAPLLGEALVSAYLGEPSPLDQKLAARISRLPG